jgi:hypothetical protein
MLERIFERVKGILLKPVEHFRLAANDTLTFAFVYYLVLLAVFGALFSFSLAGFGMYRLYSSQSMMTILVMLVQMIVSLFTGTIWLHIWTYVAGGRQGIKNTLKVVAYAMTPTLLLGWIIPVGMAAGMIWGIILQVLGVRELHQLTTGRAVLAVALSLIAMVVVILVILFLVSPDFLSAIFGSPQGGSYGSSFSY